MWRIYFLIVLFGYVCGHNNAYHYHPSYYQSPLRQSYSRPNGYGQRHRNPHAYQCNPYRTHQCRCMVGECPDTMVHVFYCGFLFSRHRCCNPGWVSRCIAREVFGGYNQRLASYGGSLIIDFLSEIAS